MAKMKMFTVFLAIICQVKAQDAGVEGLVNSIRESFSGLTNKRDLWYDNYNTLNNIAASDTIALQELLIVSKMAVPMVWSLYTGQVRGQKGHLPRLLEGHHATLPFTKAFPSPPFPYFHVEVKVALPEERNSFHVNIERNSELVYTLNIDKPNRRVELMGLTEGVFAPFTVLEGESYPLFREDEPFTVNIQYADDCVFTSFWLDEMDEHRPMPLPPKHWHCSKDYTHADDFKVTLNDDNDDVTDDVTHGTVEVVVYDGVLIQ